MRKITRIFFIIIILFIILLFVYLTPKNYNLEYKLDDVLVKETYNKKGKYYIMEYKYKDMSFKQILYNDYTKSRKLINKIDIIEEKENICLLGISDELNTYPLCKNNETYLNYHLVDNLSKKLDKKYNQKPEFNNSSYKNISINYLNDKTFLIWNYQGLDIMNKKVTKSINFFENDVYDINLAAKINDYFIIPDYTNDYYFESVHLYNVENNKKSTWNLGKKIYFDSYIMGTYENSLYLFDRKEKKEYELVPHKEKLRNVNPTTLINSNFEKVSLQKLINNKGIFTYDNPIKFKLQDGNLYRVIDEYRELVSTGKIKEIVYYDQNEVYYLIDDSLYMFNDIYGEVKLMTNFEWTFNYKNLIFIY